MNLGEERDDPPQGRRATGKAGHQCPRQTGFGVRGQMAVERFGTRLPHEVDAPRFARGLLGAWTGATLEPDQLDTARLLVSELVTNAVLHGRGTITLRVWLRADAVRVEVRDQGAEICSSPTDDPTLP